MSYQTTGSARGVGAMEGGPVTAVVGFALLLNLVGLYSYTGVALCVFGYIGLTLVLSAKAGAVPKNRGSADAGNAVMIFSWAVALVGGALVGAFHWVEYRHAAYAVLGVYALAAAIWLIGRAFDAFWSWLFPLAGVAMLMSIMHLGSPPGADDMEKGESWTPVTVMVADEAGRPIENATVYLDLVHFWQGDPELDSDRPWWSKSQTKEDGTVQMSLHDDPRFKRLVIRVRREPATGGYNEPTTIGACVGYNDVRLATTLPSAKVPYAFRLTTSQRAHPETALLAVEIDPSLSADSSTSRSIKLALTTSSELPWRDDRRTFNERALSDQGQLRDFYMYRPQHVVFRLGRDLADRPLTLHVLERDYSRYDDAYVELNQIAIDAIPLGGQFILPAIALPRRESSSGSPAIAEGLRSAELR